MDHSKLEMLGGYACALQWILEKAESQRTDKIKSGYDSQETKQSPLGFFS